MPVFRGKRGGGVAAYTPKNTVYVIMVPLSYLEQASSCLCFTARLQIAIIVTTPAGQQHYTDYQDVTGEEEENLTVFGGALELECMTPSDRTSGFSGDTDDLQETGTAAEAESSSGDSAATG